MVSAEPLGRNSPWRYGLRHGPWRYAAAPGSADHAAVLVFRARSEHWHWHALRLLGCSSICAWNEHVAYGWGRLNCTFFNGSSIILFHATTKCCGSTEYASTNCASAPSRQRATSA